MISPTTPKELSAFDQKTMELADEYAAAAARIEAGGSGTWLGRRAGLRAHLASRPEASALAVLRELVEASTEYDDAREWNSEAQCFSVDVKVAERYKRARFAAYSLISAAPNPSQATSAAFALADAEPTIPLQHAVYAWLGRWRDKVPADAVDALQCALGPLVDGGVIETVDAAQPQGVEIAGVRIKAIPADDADGVRAVSPEQSQTRNGGTK